MGSFALLNRLFDLSEAPHGLNKVVCKLDLYLIVLGQWLYLQVA